MGLWLLSLVGCLDAWPVIFEASRALPQARFRSPASPPLDSTGRPAPPSLHHGIASTTTARIAEERSSSGSSCPTTSQHAGLEERERERERALFPTSAPIADELHSCRAQSRQPRARGGMIPGLNGQIAPAIGGSRSSPGIDRLMSDVEEPWGFSAISRCYL